MVFSLSLALFGCLSGDQAQAATAEVTYFKATKVYVQMPYHYNHDRVEWSYNANWTTPGLQCHADVSVWYTNPP